MKLSTLALLALVLLAACTASRQPRIVAALTYAPAARAADEAFRAAPPPASPLSATAAFTFSKARLANGMGLLLVERHGVPVFSARLVVARGARDLAGTRAETLDLGMDALLRDHESSELATPGVHPATDCDSELCSLTARGASSVFDTGLRALADMAIRPRYTVSQEIRLQRDWSEEVLHLGSVADAAVRLNARALLFPPEDGYAPPGPEERKRIGAVRASDLAALHAQLFQPAHATLIVAGDVTLEELQAGAERAFGAWKSSVPPVPLDLRSPPLPGAAARTVLVDFTAPLVHAHLVARSPVAGDPAALAMSMFVELLSTPSGALSNEVRASMGATYDVAGFSARGRVASFVQLGGSFAPDKAVAATNAVLKALRDARDGRIAPSDFEGARARMIAGYRSSAGTAVGATGLLASTVRAGVAPEAIAVQLDHIAKLTPADVQQVARAWLPDSALRLVVVGQRKHIEKGFEDLGIGTVEWRTRRGEAAR